MPHFKFNEKILVMDIEKIFAERFKTGVTRRSDEFKAGYMASLKFESNGERIINPYRIGTAQADAFWAGAFERRFVKKLN